ncbi:MAG TPA: hypothetical protein VEY10_02995, partial [Flavisolibacter sp.]|nr:hypothetical protein [Flavisolibacter sp.]
VFILAGSEKFRVRVTNITSHPTHPHISFIPVQIITKRTKVRRNRSPIAVQKPGKKENSITNR